MKGSQSLPWDMTEHLTDGGMCDVFLSVASTAYPDLLAKVRANIARAMSGWLMKDHYRAEVWWSDQDNCFVGRLKGFGFDFSTFKGETPRELQAAFARAVHEHVTGVVQPVEEGPKSPVAEVVKAEPLPDSAPARKPRKRRQRSKRSA